MPPRRGFKRVIPLSTRKLRPLASRVKNVEKTIELVEELLNLSQKSAKIKHLLVIILLVKRSIVVAKSALVVKK